MKRQITMGALVLALCAGGRAIGGEPAYTDATPHGLFSRVHPVGGWHPYGGGLTHWWNPQCFPCERAPDDYCRKPIPRVCWPPYPPGYSFGPPEIGYRQSDGFRDCARPH